MTTNKLKDLEEQLYIARYGLPQKGNLEEIWESIKKEPEVLKEAIEIRKDKFGEKDLLKGTAIAEAMLIDYQNTDKELYQKLINTIYSNIDIARLGFGPINGRETFLLMSLWNHDLKLTENQKAFAVSEAMNKIGTVKQNNEALTYEEQLEENGITDDITSAIELGGSINPIGLKAKSIYMNHLFTSMSATQAHGTGAFDIRYQILRNPNWSIEEKQKLIMDFWYSDEEYDETLEEWEWDVVNDEANYKGELLPSFDKCDLFYEYTYDMLLNYYRNKETTDRIWSEIMFCKQMHSLRPQQWEKDCKQKEKKLNETN